MFLHVTDVTYLKDYQLRLTFANGVVKDVDLQAELYGEVFEPLKEIAFSSKSKSIPTPIRLNGPMGLILPRSFWMRSVRKSSRPGHL